MFYRKSRKFCEAISSASPMDTWTPEWIASRRKTKVMTQERMTISLITGFNDRANARSAVLYPA
jgi:hypothetical protein